MTALTDLFHIHFQTLIAFIFVLFRHVKKRLSSFTLLFVDKVLSLFILIYYFNYLFSLFVEICAQWPW